MLNRLKCYECCLFENLWSRMHYLRKIFSFLSIALCLSLLPAIVFSSPAEERIFLKRIAEYWKDQDFKMVKEQIAEFLNRYPDSKVKDNLYAVLGDLAFQEENFLEAHHFYKKIQQKEFQEKVFSKDLEALYSLGDMDAVIKSAKPLLSQKELAIKEEIQFLVANAFFKKMSSSPEGNDKIHLAQETKTLLLALQSKEYRDYATPFLAEIHRVLKEYSLASPLYLLLAEKTTDSAESLLFQAAEMQLHFNLDEAIETYSKIYALQGEKASLAAYNQFVLLCQEKKYEKLVNLAPSITPSFPSDKLSLFNFWVGNAHFYLEHFKEAASFFEAILKQERTEFKEPALLKLVKCAEKTGDEALFLRAVQNIKTSFPHSQEGAKAIVLYAQFCLKNNNPVQASEELTYLLDKLSLFEKKEELFYTYASLLKQIEKWEESRTAFYTLLKEFPETQNLKSCWNGILSCSLQTLKNTPAALYLEKQDQFIADLNTALSIDSLFSQEEKASYLFFLAQTYFELKKYEEAIKSAEQHLSLNQDPSSVGNAHLILALSYQKLQNSSDNFILHAEKALSLSASSANKGALHFQLFNTYLKKNELEKAAEHLYIGHVQENLSVRLENQLWLANYFLSKVEKDSTDSLAHERVSQIFNKLLKIKDSQMELAIDSGNTFLEVEALKYAKFLPMEQRKFLLSSLWSLQEKNPKEGWKFEDKVLFELAKCHESLQDFSQALMLYNQLIEKDVDKKSYFSSLAKLQKTRILSSLCREEDLQESNPTIIEILNSLKDLQIERNILSEPLHLEAALDYVHIRSLISKPETKMTSTLFFLNRLKENFTTQDDFASQEYQNSRSLYPEKDAIIINYLKFVDAEIYRIEAILAKENGSYDKMRELEQKASALLREVVQNEQTPLQLRLRAEKNLGIFSL